MINFAGAFAAFFAVVVFFFVVAVIVFVFGFVTLEDALLKPCLP